MHKAAQLLGMLTTLGVLALWVIAGWFNPYAPGTLTVPVAAMMVLALLGCAAAFLARPLLMLLVFGFSFFPYGFYMLGTPGIFKWIGLFNLLYGLDGLILLIGQWRLKRRV